MKTSAEIHAALAELVGNCRGKGIRPVQIRQESIAEQLPGAWDFYLPLAQQDVFLRELFKVCAMRGICFCIDKSEYGKPVILFYDTSQKTGSAIRMRIFAASAGAVTEESNPDLTGEKMHMCASGYEASIITAIYSLRMRLLQCSPLVAFMGADGSGKTTLAETLCNAQREFFRFKRLHRGSWLFQIALPFLRILSKNTPIILLDDKYAKLCLFSALLRFPWVFLTMLLRRKQWICDRFFFDCLMENLRFADKTPKLRSSYRLLLKLIPRAKYMFLIDAPNKVIHSRRLELAEPALNFYRTAVFDLYLLKSSPLFCYISTVEPLEVCTGIADGIIKM
jgi:thymidylate kinase